MSKYSDHSQYYYNDEEIPSVTTILKILAKPGINKWANYLGFKRQKIDDVLESSANIGTEVHDLINHYIFGDRKTIMDKGISCEEVATRFKNFILWYKDRDITPIFGEQSYTTDKFGGTIDFYCEYEGKKTIIDFKTSKNFYSSMFLQLAAYVDILNFNDMEVEQVGILLVGVDRTSIHFISVDELDLYKETFRKLADLFHNIYELNIEWKDLL